MYFCDCMLHPSPCPVIWIDIPLYLKINFVSYIFIGGGPPSKPLSALAETVQMVIGESNAIITGIDGGIDSSVLHLITDDNVW